MLKRVEKIYIPTVQGVKDMTIVPDSSDVIFCDETGLHYRYFPDSGAEEDLFWVIKQGANVWIGENQAKIYNVSVNTDNLINKGDYSILSIAASGLKDVNHSEVTINNSNTLPSHEFGYHTENDLLKLKYKALVDAHGVQTLNLTIKEQRNAGIQNVFIASGVYNTLIYSLDNLVTFQTMALPAELSTLNRIRTLDYKDGLLHIFYDKSDATSEAHCLLRGFGVSGGVLTYSSYSLADFSETGSTYFAASNKIYGDYSYYNFLSGVPNVLNNLIRRIKNDTFSVREQVALPTAIAGVQDFIINGNGVYTLGSNGGSTAIIYKISLDLTSSTTLTTYTGGTTAFTAMCELNGYIYAFSKSSVNNVLPIGLKIRASDDVIVISKTILYTPLITISRLASAITDGEYIYLCQNNSSQDFSEILKLDADLNVITQFQMAGALLNPTYKNGFLYYTDWQTGDIYKVATDFSSNTTIAYGANPLHHVNFYNVLKYE